MTRKYVRRSQATINLTWIDEEAHAEILALWEREQKENRPPDVIIKGYDHEPHRRQYAFGREVQRYHGNGFSHNYVGFIVDQQNQIFQVDVWNYQSGNRARAILSLNAIPCDPCAFFELAKKQSLARGSDSETGTLSFNRKAVEETWAYFLAGLDLLPKYEVERMHEMTGYDS
jgi:hypothetical protein